MGKIIANAFQMRATGFPWSFHSGKPVSRRRLYNRSHALPLLISTLYRIIGGKGCAVCIPDVGAPQEVPCATPTGWPPRTA
jgi:hypothetical protein